MITRTNNLLAIRRINFLEYLSEKRIKNSPPRNSPAPYNISILNVRLLSYTGERLSLKVLDMKIEMKV